MSSSSIHTKVANFTKWLMAKKWLFLVLPIIVAFMAGNGGANLSFDNSYRVFFGDNNPQLQAFDAIEKIYSKNDNVLVVVEPKTGTVFTNKTMSLIERMTQELWQTPYSTRVDSLTNFQHTAAYGDELVVRDLITDAASLGQDQLDAARAIALAEPLLKNRLITDKSNVTAVNITLNLPDGDPNAEIEISTYMKTYVAALESEFPDHNFYLSGVVMLSSTFAESSMKDLSTLTPLMYLIIVLLMFFFFRNIPATISSVVVIVLSVMTGMGVAGWLGFSLSGPSALAPTVILTLAVADSIHILVTFLQKMRAGLNKHDAMVESMRINFKAVFITSLTTIIGFLSLNFSDTPPLRDLGNITAIGVFAAFAYSVIFIPAFMALVPVRVKVREEKAKGSSFLSNLAETVIAKRKQFFYGILLIAIFLTALIPTIRLNDKFVEYFDMSVPFRQDTEFVMNNLTGIYQIDYSLTAGKSSGVSEPEYMQKVEAFTQWLRAQDKVLHVNTYTDIMKRVNKSMHGDDPSYYKLPEDKELAAQYLLLYEFSLPYGLDLNNQINIEKSSTRLVVTMKNVTSDDIRLFAKEGDAWLNANAPDLVHYDGTGPSVMFANISNRNIKSMVYGTSLALLIIMVILMFAFRSFRYGLLSLIPNAVPILMSFGVWALLIGWAGFGISVVASVTLGIVVDDTVHFLSKYLRARREEGLAPVEAVRYAFSTVGEALLVTSIVLIIGFAVLTLSPFMFNKHLGLLSCITIALALVIDFLFLPPLLLFLDKDKGEKV